MIMSLSALAAGTAAARPAIVRNREAMVAFIVSLKVDSRSGRLDTEGSPAIFSWRLMMIIMILKPESKRL